MTTYPTIVFCDFDGTLFDPDARLVKAPFYNRKTSKLLKDAILVITTGRHSWDTVTKIHYKLTGMRQPDLIIAGAGTFVYWRRGNDFVLDTDWEARMKDGWDKHDIEQKLQPFLKEHHVGLIGVPNPYMVVVTIYGKPMDTAIEIREELEKLLKNEPVKIILSEQLFLPNTEHVFSGYALIIPKGAGKDNSSLHIIKEYEKQKNTKLNMFGFGDASIDVPLLTMKAPAGIKEYKSYGLHLTPLARRTVGGFKNEKHVTMPTLLDGSAPASIYAIFKEYFASPRNSPLRKAVAPFEAIIDRTVYPNLTPNELTLKGLEEVQAGLDKAYSNGSLFSRLGGFVTVARGHLMDATDGIRARRHPELSTEDGQLVDGYADRMKEFSELARRGRFEAALSCALPSIARAQAEAMGKTVPELDPSGGSAYSRNKKLLSSLFSDIMGMKKRSAWLDEQIFHANLETYKNRRKIADGFSWNVTKMKTYDRTALVRLLFYIDILQNQYAEVSANHQVTIPQLDEYLSVDTKKLRTHLKLSTHDLGKSLDKKR